VDGLAYFDGPGADLAFRRGWTHGIAALIVLPFLLTGAMLLLDRGIRRARRAGLPSGVVPRQILLLAAVSILTHPILDTLHPDGVRWLMAFGPVGGLLGRAEHLIHVVLEHAFGR
jgi:inner membrane protein